MSETEIEMAVMAQQRNHALDAAMYRLLHDLREFIRAYPRTEDAEMPDHDIVWAEGMLNGPGKIILEAIKANPVLWGNALPSDVCIVPRKSFEKLCISLLHANYLIAMGENMVLSHAANAKSSHSI